MYKCDVCGRESNKKIRMGGYTLCSKHMHQLHKYGKFLDAISRTNNDLNDYEISDCGVYFNLYNQKNEFIGKFVVDFADIEKVKYHKWRKSHGHVVTGTSAQGTIRDITHVLLDLTKDDLQSVVVDHIDGDPMNNRKSNLRICKQSENLINKSFMSNNSSGFIGVSFRKNRNMFDPEIRIHDIRCHLGCCKTLEEAVYARYIAEQLVFKEFANRQEQQRKYEASKKLSNDRKKEIEQRVKIKLNKKKLWQ